MEKRIALYAALVLLAIGSIVPLNCVPPSSASADSPSVVARKTPTLTVNSLTFKDLNKNGVLDEYEDWRLPVGARVADLVSKMTLPEKAGMMMHATLMGFTGPNGIVMETPLAAGPGKANPTGIVDLNVPKEIPGPTELIIKRHIRYILTRPLGETPDITARWSNGIQEIAEGSRLGIPIVVSSDPRHSSQRPGGSGQSTLSQWPQQIGLGAIGDPNVVREFGRIAAGEYRAIGIRAALHPMADVATEPRWARINGTFGEDAKLAANLVQAYIEGFQGKQLGPGSVMCITKHWPGDGPTKDGLDPHNDYGKYQVYPGHNLDYHLIPFQAAFKAGTAGIMPAYSIPVGVDTVGMNFSKIVVKDLLRHAYGFDGLVLTDWLRAMPWGVESLTVKDRQRLIIEAGCDQLGGEDDPGYIIELVKEGTLPEARIDESLRRILKPMFQLGLFENPYVDPEQAKSVVANEESVRAGEAAQRKSIVLLKNAKGLLPLSGKPKLYVENMSNEAASQYGTVVEDLKMADVAIIKVTAPYEIIKGGSFRTGVHEGTLAYAGAENAKELDAIRRVASSGTPTIVCMYMDRPAILSEFIDDVSAVLAHFNSNDKPILDVLFGRYSPTGKLPFNLPRDMASVKSQKEDVPHDLQNPLFRFGFGLTYESARQK